MKTRLVFVIINLRERRHKERTRAQQDGVGWS